MSRLKRFCSRSQAGVLLNFFRHLKSIIGACFEWWVFPFSYVKIVHFPLAMFSSQSELGNYDVKTRLNV